MVVEFDKKFNAISLEEKPEQNMLFQGYIIMTIQL